MDSAECASLCSDEGHCCQDPAVGSNQLISCAQACHIREQGTDFDTCLSLCDEVADTGGCSTTVNGHTYNHCQTCSDLHEDCPHGVQSVRSCYRGCAIAGGQNRQRPPASVVPSPTPAPLLPPDSDDLDAAMHRIYAMGAGHARHGKVVSMADNNELFKNGESVAILNKGVRWTGPVNDFDEFSASGPIYGSVRDDSVRAGGEHVMASGRLKGQSFSFGNDRRSVLSVWTRALEADAFCSVRTNAGTVASQAMSAGTGYIFHFDTHVGSDQGVVVTCDADVVIAVGHTDETDYMVVPPESTEWYGVISTRLSLSQSGATALTVQEACSDGSTRSLTVPGGGTGAWSESGYGAQYTGKACKYSAAAPFNVHSWADADGGDAVNLLPTSTGSMSFGTSTQFEWLAFASLELGRCRCSHGDVSVDTCANGVCKGRISGGVPGVTCDCSVPMWGVMECQETNDEQLFYGDLAYRGAERRPPDVQQPPGGLVRPDGRQPPETIDCSFVDCVRLTPEDCAAPQVYIDSGCCGACADPPCRMGGRCGGQVWNDCGSACPGVCGEEPSQMCNMMCVSGYQCPGDRPLWDAEVSACTVATECSGLLRGRNSTGTLPPGVAVGRPFFNHLDRTALLPATTASAVQMMSDWIGCDV